MKLIRAGVITAGVLAGSLALAACGSSGNKAASPSPSGTGTGSGTTSAGAISCASKGSLKAEGSTAQTNAMTAWINAYDKACGSTINYNPTGSGAGVSSFIAKQVDFAGSDSALDPTAGEPTKAQARCASPALDLPMVIGPIAIGFNVSGVSSLTLTPDLIAKIFTGKISTWNDAAIAKENSGAKLPSSKINVIYRSDASGTTANFEKFLSATDPTDFTATPAKDNAATVFKGQGVAKSQGVAAAIKSTSNSIGYDEYSFAVQSSLNTAAVDSGAGAVQVSKDTASAAAEEATVTGTGNDLTLKLNYKPTSKNAYPIILATYEIACTKYSDAATGALVKSFLNYTATGGQSLLAGLGYAPLPTTLQSKVEASIAKIS